MHGGASGSGAPIGNQNALKTGQYSREAILLRYGAAAIIRECRKFAKRVENLDSPDSE